MVDPLNIFEEIGDSLKKEIPLLQIYATGSRVSGFSYAKKWDFDIIIVHPDNLEKPVYIKQFLYDKFLNRKDENDKDIRIDIWYVTVSNSKRFLSKLNSGKNVKLL